MSYRLPVKGKVQNFGIVEKKGAWLKSPRNKPIFSINKPIYPFIMQIFCIHKPKTCVKRCQIYSTEFLKIGIFLGIFGLVPGKKLHFHTSLETKTIRPKCFQVYH